MAGKTEKEIPRRHYCPEHDILCRITRVLPGGKMRYRCVEGCDLAKTQVILR